MHDESLAGMPRPPRPLVEYVVLLVSVALYAVSLAMPVMAETHPGGYPIDERGGIVLVVGWMGLLMGQLSWFANPLWGVGVIHLVLRRREKAALFAGLAVLVAADAFLLYRTGTPSDSGDAIPTSLRPGFYVWWASMWVLAIGALLMRRVRPLPAAPFVERPR